MKRQLVIWITIPVVCQPDCRHLRRNGNSIVFGWRHAGISFRDKFRLNLTGEIKRCRSSTVHPELVHDAATNEKLWCLLSLGNPTGHPFEWDWRGEIFATKNAWLLEPDVRIAYDNRIVSSLQVASIRRLATCKLSLSELVWLPTVSV